MGTGWVLEHYDGSPLATICIMLTVYVNGKLLVNYLIKLMFSSKVIIYFFGLYNNYIILII